MKVWIPTALCTICSIAEVIMIVLWLLAYFVDPGGSAFGPVYIIFLIVLPVIIALSLIWRHRINR